MITILEKIFENEVSLIKTEEEKSATIENCIKFFISEFDEDELSSFCLHVLCKFFDKSLVVRAHQKVLGELHPIEKILSELRGVKNDYENL